MLGQVDDLVVHRARRKVGGNAERTRSTPPQLGGYRAHGGHGPQVGGADFETVQAQGVQTVCCRPHRTRPPPKPAAQRKGAALGSLELGRQFGQGSWGRSLWLKVARMERAAWPTLRLATGPRGRALRPKSTAGAPCPTACEPECRHRSTEPKPVLRAASSWISPADVVLQAEGNPPSPFVGRNYGAGAGAHQ